MSWRATFVLLTRLLFVSDRSHEHSARKAATTSLTSLDARYLILCQCAITAESLKAWRMLLGGNYGPEQIPIRLF